MRIAVIGAGLGGLAAAWLLGRAGRQVTLYERAPRPGFTAANVAVPGRGAAATSANEAVRVDVPLRVFYPGYYPTLTRLYADLGVPSEPVSYAASFHGPAWAGRDAAALYFRYRNLRWGGRSVAVPGLADWALGAPVWPAWRMAAAALRWRQLALPALARGELAGRTIGDWAAAQRLPRPFIDGLLLPAIATVCTCSLAQAAAVPAAVAVDYMARGLLRQSVHRALHGADDVQRRLLAGIADLRCGAVIDAVRRLPGDAGVELRLADGATEHVDHVVLATQAGASLRLLADADADETAALAGLPDTPVQVVTHSDARLMPARRRDWSPVNLWVDTAGGQVESTIWVNAVQPVLRGAPDVFQTVGPLRPVAAASVLGEARFQRPLVTLDSERALTALQALQTQPGRRVWFCGSQAQPGVPLLESAVRSAYVVAGRLGAAPGRVADSSA
ncbi:MAG TPA: NAD(P)-binding protein [Aquabacterium sp.]|nr:NAD(P)-binding protein [Aquabacterium sp.]HQC95902.1 NAD(P)-binding protein [Aquabacterium sp.]